MKKIVMTSLVAVVCLSGSFSSLSVEADEPVYETRAMVQEDSRLGPGADAGQVISHTGRVSVNGYLDDGSYQLRPGVGVIWP